MTNQHKLCPNCETEVPESDYNFCNNCGQENRDIKLPVRYFVTDFFESLTNLDTKTFHSLRDLLWSPGLLTKNFNANKRARYVPPFRLYLLTSALFFLLLTFVFKKTVVENEANFRNTMIKETGAGQISMFTLTRFSGEQFKQLLAIEEVSVAKIDSFCQTSNIKTDFINSRILKGMLDFRTGRLQASQIEEMLFENLSYSLFLCMPIFAFLLYLFNDRNKYFFSEHFVFALHFHTYIFIILGISSLIAKSFFTIPSSLTMVFCYGIFTKSMYTVYQETWRKTIVKTLGILLFYLICLAFAFLTSFVWIFFKY
ncbi:MAG: hypothetical protein RLZZ292_1845 [Bacteroidota bacterium]|jgi:hypothetical protein